jgi:hypothetical protein
MKVKPKINEHRLVRNIDEDDNPEGYPSYPATEDIYGKFQKARNINPEEPTKDKTAGKIRAKNIKDFSDDLTGEDLDVPGSELDDDMEMNGEEDEENNYYSLGGDNHNDLEEDYN